MNAARKREIYSVVRSQVLAPLWRAFRSDRKEPVVSPFELLPIRPELFIQEHLRFAVERPEEIVPDIPVSTEIAGVLDRELRRIVVANKFPIVAKRFIAAHEIGHYFLHPDLIYHRDLPIVESERINEPIPEEEREANFFAAELLMPRRLVADIFHARYGPRIHPDEIDTALAFRLSRPLRLPLGDLGRLRGLLKSMSRYERACLIARDDQQPGLPLWSIFAVSIEAMAIRLVELDLVF